MTVKELIEELEYYRPTAMVTDTRGYTIKNIFIDSDYEELTIEFENIKGEN